MTLQLIEQAANALTEAARTGKFTAPLRDTYEQMTIEDAYAVQRFNTDRRLKDGQRLVGCKIGLTSLAVQKQLGVDRPDFGMLFDDMGYGDGDPIPASILSHRRMTPCPLH
jgi:2-keto-4-pentenoate hydratase